MAAIPKTMTAIEIEPFGPPEGLKPCTRPVPTPGEGEVLIKVAFAGVNRPDVLQRLGGYPPPPGAPDIPGLEVAGEIVACGANVGSWRTGDFACALVAGGGYAEYCTAPAPQCLPVPDTYSLEEAAALPETFFTVWTNVFERGRLAPGETLLVHGGSSGIGTTAIQLGRAFGSRVLATAGSEEKCRVCESLGAERAINYREADFVEVVKEAGGADVILDMVGGPYLARDLAALKVEGRLCIIAFLEGSVVDCFDFQDVLVRRLTITGSTLRPRTVAQKATITEALRERVWPLLAARTVEPVLHRRFPLAEASEAHRLMESSAHIGKIMLECA